MKLPNRVPTVLIVDDVEATLMIVEGVLEDRYRIRLASSGQAALDIVHAGPPPDLILLDVVMPGMSGYEVCAALKADPATRDIPIIFLTGQNELDDEIRGFQLGAVDYLTKPISPLILLARVGAHLENARLYEEKNHVTELLRRALLPRLGLSIPGLELGHRFLPSKLLSGDFYDVISLGGQRLGVVMADVAGKGPEAAIQTARAKHFIRASAMAGVSAGRIFELLNGELGQDEESLNLTAFFAEIDIASHTLRYCNAGHEPSWLWEPERQGWRELGCTAIMLGATDSLEAEERQLAFEPGALLLLLTDGLTEARSPAGAFMGVEPLLAVFSAHLLGSVQEAVDAVYEEVERFAAGSFSDDVSLLALRLP